MPTDVTLPSSILGMSLFGFLLLLVIAAVCGAIGQAIAGFSRGGCLISIVMGFIGAWLGTWLANEMGLPQVLTINIDGQPFPILWSIVGAALFSLIIGLFTQRMIVNA